MGRNFGATDKSKGSQRSETAMPGVTAESAAYLQKKLGKTQGQQLDQEVVKAAYKPAGEEL